MELVKNISQSNQKNIEVQQNSYELQNFQTFQFQRDKVQQQKEKQMVQQTQQINDPDFKTYYYQKRHNQEQQQLQKSVNDVEISQISYDQISNINASNNNLNISQNNLNKSQQQITLYEVNTIYFTKHRKFRQYFIDLINYKMKFDYQELTPSNFYYSPNERALHFTETINNQNYNRIYLDSIIKTIYFEVDQEEEKKKCVFMAIKYHGQQHTKSTMLIEIANPEIINILKDIMEMREQKIELYNHGKLIDSNENSFDVEASQGNKQRKQEEKEEDREIDELYAQYLERGQEQTTQRQQAIGNKYSGARFKGKVEKSIVAQMQSQLQAEALAVSLLNEQQLEALEKYRQQDEMVREYHPDIQSFMVKQLTSNGYKRVNGNQLQGPDGYVVDISDFEHKEDGYIYGPVINLEKDEFGRMQEIKTIVKTAPGIFKQNQDGILYGPDGQRYGHKEKVVPKKLVIMAAMNNTTQPTQLSPVSNTTGKFNLQKGLANSIMNNQFDQVTKETVRHNLHECITTLQNGIVFIKYGMRDYFSGSKRKLFIDQSLTYICWTTNLSFDTQTKKEITSTPLKQSKINNSANLKSSLKSTNSKSDPKNIIIKDEPVKQIPLIADKLEKSQNLDASQSNTKIQIDPKQFNQLKSSNIFNLKSKIEMVDKNALDKSTIYLDHDGSMKETEEQNIVYEIVGEKQQKINKLFEISKIIQIINGRKTKNFKRFSTNKPQRNENSFSIVFKDRTIDLEALNAEDKTRFLNSLIFVVKNIDFQKNHKQNKSPRKSILNTSSKK